MDTHVSTSDALDVSPALPPPRTDVLAGASLPVSLPVGLAAAQMRQEPAGPRGPAVAPSP